MNQLKYLENERFYYLENSVFFFNLLPKQPNNHSSFASSKESGSFFLNVSGLNITKKAPVIAAPPNRYTGRDPY